MESKNEDLFGYQEPPESDDSGEYETSPPPDGDVVAAMLAYVPFLCFYALLLKRNDPYALLHGKQGFVLFIAELVAVALRWDLIWNLLLIFLGGVSVYAIISVWRGGQFRIPFLANLLNRPPSY